MTWAIEYPSAFRPERERALIATDQLAASDENQTFRDSIMPLYHDMVRILREKKLADCLRRRPASHQM